MVSNQQTYSGLMVTTTGNQMIEDRYIFIGGPTDGSEDEYIIVSKSKKEWAISEIKEQPFF